MEKILLVVSIKDKNTGEQLNNYSCGLCDIFLHPNMAMSKVLSNGAKLHIQAKPDQNSYPFVKFKIRGKDLPKQGGWGFGSCDPFFRIKKTTNYGKMGTNFETVYESEVFRDQKSPHFKKMLLSYQRLCDGNQNNEIWFEVFDHAKRSEHLRVGKVKTTLNEMLKLTNGNGSLVLKNQEGKKSGELIFDEVGIVNGPSVIREIGNGLRLNVIWGIDCAKIDSNTTDLKEREDWMNKITQTFVNKADYLFHEGKIQFFGMNGKCSTDNLFTNTVMDLFPLSGDIEKNSFHFSQINTPFFGRNLKNFLNNTEGAENCTLSKFVQFCADHAGETCQVSGQVFTVAFIFFWHIPTDMNEIASAIIANKGRKILYLFVYLGKGDHEKLKTLDGRKYFFVDDLHQTLWDDCKSFFTGTHYSADSELLIKDFLLDMPHVICGDYRKMVDQGSRSSSPTRK